MRLMRIAVFVLCAVLWEWLPILPPDPVGVASGQINAPGIPTGTGVSMTISNSAVTIATATGGSTTFCPNLDNGALLFVVNNGIYFTLGTTTPSSSYMAAASGSWLYVKPWGRINMIRQSADTTVAAWCMQ